jgi:threonine/homoserine/homoserine lactone efflux protein
MAGLLMELYFFLATVILISLSGVMAPGPLFAAAVVEGRKSVFSGFIISAGHAAVEIPLIIALFLSGITIRSESVKTVVGILGGIVLLYFAFIEYRNYGRKVEGSSGKGFITGIAMSSLNPYFIVWWLTVGFALINQSILFGVYGLLLFIIAHEMCDFLWLGFVSATSHKTAYMWGEKAYKTLSIVSISIFLLFGVYFFVTGIFTFMEL